MTSSSPDSAGRPAIRTIGRIQPCGWLLVLDAEASSVLQASANLPELTGLPMSQVLRARPAELLGRRLAIRLKQEIKGRSRLPAPLAITRRVGEGSMKVQVNAHRRGDRVIVEIEPLGPMGQRRLMALVNEWLRRIGEAESRDRLLDTLVEGVAQLTGHDRVLVCRFDADWHGKVVAEHRHGPVASLLGQHFPASDFPAQARSLIEQNPVRSVPDVQARPVEVLAYQENSGAMRDDLAACVLRAPSPEQVSYQEHLGVGAMLSIPIQSQQELWGLLIGHAMAPVPLAPAIREAARALVQMAAQRLFLLRARQEARYLQRVQDSRDLLTRARRRLPSPESLVQRHGAEWLALFRAQGVTLVHHGQLVSFGQVPSLEALDTLVSRLEAQHTHEGPWYTANAEMQAMTQGLALDGICGVLAIPLRLNTQRRDWLLLFRPEQVETLYWAVPGAAAGDRSGSAPAQPLPGRHSAWREEVSGRSIAWERIERLAAMDLGEDLALAASVHEIERLNARLHQEQQALADANRRLEQLAHFDSLTGVWNRYRIEQAIDVELAAAERYGRSFALLLFDADHFKRINDRFGHEMGDRVLRELARRVGQSLRGCDHLGRWGGEEFVVLATETDREAAVGLGERLRRLIAEVAVEGLPLSITASIGVALWQPGDSRKTLVKRADQAMYRAKTLGRDRVCLEDGGADASPVT
ncbi:diguanylate cyclase [Halomonas campisalis]|uniref:diguanylate cyclase n=1 Tax=Billgrantia campisalis TaxID=74661 RepID=A0ABS9P7J8_9GAMM|nr:sensor domain-containing diguanylate cyclase [Halomonas campisalis]MCG6657755.1 diguanylate cyclase [Halomonas campisalis]MDR5862473.1 diguanylate cyclase [Halomonas campisalis]